MSVEGNIENNQTMQKITGKIVAVPKVDDTLTRAGWSADAKITGDELARIEAKIDSCIAAIGNEE